MIYTGSVRDISDKYDEVWMIVRSLKFVPQVNASVFHIPQLSPSPELFKSYLSWKNQGLWDKDTFEKYYKPRFLQEMQEVEAQTYLNLLIEKAKTKNILLVCYCQDKSICHRSLIYSLIPSALRG